MDVRTPERVFSRLSRREWTIIFLVLVAAAPFTHRMGEQQASRYALTAAIWDDHSFSVDNQAHLLGRDKAIVDGSYFSDKAPGQPILAVPAYAAYRLLGGAPAADMEASTRVGLWAVTFWSATIPAALLAVLMYRAALHFDRMRASAAALALTFGTLLFPYSTLLFSHVLAALYLFAAYQMSASGTPSTLRLVAAGALCGLAVFIEYPAALLAVLVFGFASYRHRAKALWVAVGGLPFLGMILGYNRTVFGGFFTFPYQWSGFGPAPDNAISIDQVFDDPTFRQLLGVLFSERGLLVGTPVVAVALAAVVLLWRRGERTEAVVSVVAAALMLGLLAFWGNPYAGGPGPRYFVIALPFLTAPLVVALSRWRLVARLAVAISALTMIAATLVEPQLGSDVAAGLGFWLRLGAQGTFSESVYTLLLGPVGALVHVLTVLVAFVLLSRVGERSDG